MVRSKAAKDAAPTNKPAAKKQRGSSSRDSEIGVRFRDEDFKAWFKKLEKMELFAEKAFADSILASVSIVDMFENIGWGPVVQIKGDIYEVLVREFYANMYEKDKHRESIKSWVRGVEVEVTESDIAAEFANNEIEAEGRKFKGDWQNFVGSFDDLEVAQSMKMRPEPHSKKDPRIAYKTYAMDPHLKLAMYVMTHNVAPQTSSSNEARLVDVYVLRRMDEGLGEPKLNYPSIVLYYMKEVVRVASKPRHLVFPRLISSILIKKKVKVERIPCKAQTDSQLFRDCDLYRLSLVRDKDTNEIRNMTDKEKAAKGKKRAASDGEGSESDDDMDPIDALQEGQSSHQAPPAEPRFKDSRTITYLKSLEAKWEKRWTDKEAADKKRDEENAMQFKKIEEDNRKRGEENEKQFHYIQEGMMTLFRHFGLPCPGAPEMPEEHGGGGDIHMHDK